ncbi:MAG: alpha/beta hydrolase [Betaproteobacteria bacterium]
MTPRSERRTLAGGAGAIEVALDWPAAAAPLGIACIGHPHPLYGGTLDNKVAATLARAFAGLGWLAVRPNFRGVGASAGTHDHGRGETEDFLLVTQAARGWLERGAALPLALAGFSFGSFVAAQTAAALTAQGMAPAHLVLVGIAAGKWPMPAVPADALLVHGEFDETIPLADVLAWARPLEAPVVVVPGADHFFHRRLTLLKTLVARHVRGASSIDGAD